jgi:quinol monooxygenase YgiN
MVAVWVHFVLWPRFVTLFRDAACGQARTSLSKERACHKFDVCVDQTHPDEVLVYQLYDSRDAFDLHLTTAHFAEFEALTRDWVREKTVRVWRRLEG